MSNPQSVQVNGFKERKTKNRLYGGGDKEFGDMLVELDKLSYLYIIESCYGKFISNRSGEHRIISKFKVPLFYHEAFLDFGVNTTPQSYDFLSKVEDIVNNNEGYASLRNSHPSPVKKRFMGPNEFHFRILPESLEDVLLVHDSCYFTDLGIAKEFEKIRDKIWQEWVDLIKGSRNR